MSRFDAPTVWTGCVGGVQALGNGDCIPAGAWPGMKRQAVAGSRPPDESKSSGLSLWTHQMTKWPRQMPLVSPAALQHQGLLVLIAPGIDAWSRFLPEYSPGRH